MLVDLICSLLAGNFEEVREYRDSYIDSRLFNRAQWQLTTVAVNEYRIESRSVIVSFNRAQWQMVLNRLCTVTCRT